MATNIVNTLTIDEIEDYISTNYLQLIQDKIDILRLKRKQIEDKINLYKQLNAANNLLITQIKSDIKYITIINNQSFAKFQIEELNLIIKNLNALLSYKDLIILNNLDYKKDLYSSNKSSTVDGQFNELYVDDPIASKGAVNRQYLTTELNKLEEPPKPLQPLKYLGTDSAGNLIWI